MIHIPDPQGSMPLDQIAQTLDAAARHGRATPQVSGTRTLSVEDAYAVQAMSIQRRIDRGERLVGIKMGLTSLAKMAQMGVSDVVWGRLTDAMTVRNGDVVDLAGLIHPRVEPEVAFLMKHALSGPATREEALAAIEAVCPALEIIDSRYENFRFDLADVIADNASSARYVLGEWRAPTLEVADRLMTMSIDGLTVRTGSSSDILGHPLDSLAAGARLVEQSGLRLEPGWIVLAGGATAAEPLSPGRTIRLDVEGLGSVQFTTAGSPA
ncbi:fumarylacetoacetate hydrolase family protein [uncultured Brevundimonas sp.]|uniref:2-keto-4-pentenoate hydratase n=1 Tax=uncultured Brevundimonas sp. TaxID=213418 RepID=UPI00261D555C|nr:fumarylacetoacetate hydrolase family protein [uncultured Brevundimonas sp.]